MAFVSLTSVTLRYSWPMLGHLRKIFAHHISLREKTAILQVGRDLWMIAVGTVLVMSNYWMQVSIGVDPLSWTLSNVGNEGGPRCPAVVLNTRRSSGRS